MAEPLMNDTVGNVLSLLAIVALTGGTALFVAAEFSLAALDRSVVESHARRGGRRDRFIRHAQHTLSFQLSGAQLGISITTLTAGYLTDPLVAMLPHPGMAAIGISEGLADGITTLVVL